jgi:hypothetical protein
MEGSLFGIEITPQIIYLSLILTVIGRALKDVPFIGKWSIIWILMAISLIVNLVFSGINFKAFFEAFIATAIATTIYQIYHQTRKGIKKNNTI